MVLVFVNTRLQAEYTFQELWRLNEDTLPIALHHGSLDASQRRRVEAAMASGQLRAIVCTATLDLGIDWGDVDLVINVDPSKLGPSARTRASSASSWPYRASLAPADLAAETIEDPALREVLERLGRHVQQRESAGQTESRSKFLFYRD